MEGKRYARLSDEERKKHIHTVAQNKKRRINAVTTLAISSGDANTDPNFTEGYTLPPLHGMIKNESCKFCGAMRFPYEPPAFCCYNGQVVLAEPAVPEALRDLYRSQSEEAIQFRKNIRAYNSILSFTSFGVRLDRELASSRKGNYVFRAQGQTYHDLPQLVPSERGLCYFQLYFYDTDNELQNRLNILKDTKLNAAILSKLMEMLNQNPYAQVFQRLKDAPLDTCEIRIRTDIKLDQRIYNAPSADQVAAIWVEGNDPNVPHERDIVVHAHSGHRHRIKHYFSCYDPLQYVLLFPRGEPGWHQNIAKRNRTSDASTSSMSTQGPSFTEFTSAEDILRKERGLDGGGRTKVSCRQYTCYKLQIRENDQSILLFAGRLLQQYVVDMYIKLETTRLDFYRRKQHEIRAELYQGILDSVIAGETRASKVGKRIVLPASFVGGPRDMRRRYLDAMCIVQHFGKPDLFITMTCNPEWEEIQSELKDGQTAQDRPDLTARVFRAKLQDLREQLFKKHIFGVVAAHVHVIEFQKRGLPHAHMLLIMKPQYKISNPNEDDRYICAEIPNPDICPELHEKVIKHMMHGPCGELKSDNSCMREGSCKNRYPRSFCEKAMQGKDSYAIYRRRKDGRQVLVRKAMLDNRWVVPYNPYLLNRYNCHINVEICSGVKAVKYLYKYIYKGHDKVAVYVAENSDNAIVDEIQHFQDARWVSAQEAMWRIFEFDLNEMYPSVINLQLHLPNKQCVSYWKYQNLESLIDSEFASKTMLTEFFKMCREDKEKKQYLYRDFPKYFVWKKQGKFWEARKSKEVIGRINGANPSEGERYYLRLLLNHVTSPTSFEDLLTYNGVQNSSFKAAAQKRGLLQSDNYILECLHDAVSFQMPFALRRLFAVILVYFEPADVRRLWELYVDQMSDDFKLNKGITEESRTLQVLQSIDFFLNSMGKTVRDYDLPIMDLEQSSQSHASRREIDDELALQFPMEDFEASLKLNPEQEIAYTTILKHANEGKAGAVFFIDGPGGTGKTYLYRALLATIRSKGEIAIATATSGVAASIMPGGRTAHSRFKIPIDGNEASVCNIPKQSGIAELLQRAKLIVWDEAPMAKRWAIEALDRSLRDIMDQDVLFGGKVMVFGGDFRQVLPVIPRGTRAEIINASLAMSYLWPQMKKLKLTRNMRASSDPEFSEFLLRVGNGEEPTTGDDLIQLPGELVIEGNGKGNDKGTDGSEDSLINEIFPFLQSNAHSAKYISERAILATTNESVDILNEKLIRKFPGKVWTYFSFDEAIDDTHNYYPEEFLNTLTPNGLPPYKLSLKVNSPIMLLRNLDPSNGIYNGTRMVCKRFEENVIHAEITIGQHAGKSVLLPRIPLLPSEDESYPFKFKRTQFPIRLCFAMTINKSQGQTIPHVGVYLPQSVFSHGQLYVALSRGTSMSTTKVLVEGKTNKGTTDTWTKNIVYKELLNS